MPKAGEVKSGLLPSILYVPFPCKLSDLGQAAAVIARAADLGTKKRPRRLTPRFFRATCGILDCSNVGDMNLGPLIYFRDVKESCYRTKFPCGCCLMVKRTVVDSDITWATAGC